VQHALALTLVDRLQRRVQVQQPLHGGGVDRVMPEGGAGFQRDSQRMAMLGA
jgi:hypothetical protein